MGEAHLFPLFFLHTMHTFSSVMMHFTCWCRMRSSWTWEQRDWGGGPTVWQAGQEEGWHLRTPPAFGLWRNSELLFWSREAAGQHLAWDRAAQLHTLLPHQWQPYPPGAAPAKRRRPGRARGREGTAGTHVEAAERSPGSPLSVRAMGSHGK